MQNLIHPLQTLLNSPETSCVPRLGAKFPEALKLRETPLEQVEPALDPTDSRMETVEAC